MSKGRRTTIDRLRRTEEMQTAGDSWETYWVNPNGHPLPTLPDTQYLREVYLPQVAEATPWLLEEATRLVNEITTQVEENVM